MDIELPGYKIDLPEIPTGAFPPNLRDFIEATAKNIQIAPEMVAVPLLSVLGAALQSRFVVRVDSTYSEPLCLYTLTIARPSERKSAVMSLLEKPFWNFQQEENEKELPIDKKPVTLYVTDATPEKLARLMEENNGAIALFSDEPDALAVAAGLRYGKSKNLGLLLQAWNAGRVMIQRATDDKRTAVSRAVMSIAVMSQPSFVEALMKDREMSERGFMQRFLYCQPLSKVGLRSFYKPEIPKVLLDEYNNLITTFLKMPSELRELRLSESAVSYAAVYFGEIERQIEKESYMEGWLGKLFGQVLRIAGILHCAIWQTEAAEHEIESDTINAATDLGDYFIEHAKAIFTDMEITQEIKDARNLYRKIDESGKSAVSRNELHNMISLRGERLDCALSLLIKNGFVGSFEEKTEGAKKPTTYYVISRGEEPEKDELY